jgi:hypothetical protein
MPDNTNALTRQGQTDEGQDSSTIELEIPEVSQVRAYVRAHTVHSWAANDEHRFALADFLIQHQRQRANAVPESDDMQ